MAAVMCADFKFPIRRRP